MTHQTIRKRVTRRLAIPVGVVLTMASLNGLNAASLTKEVPPPTIHIAGQGNPSGKPYGSAVIGVVREGHYLEDEFKADGVKIDWQFPRGTGPAINEGLASGQIDFANYGGLPNIVGEGAGLRTKVLASYGSAPAFLVERNGLNITSLAALRAKKIGVSRGTILELSLVNMLSKGGLSESDVQVFDLGSADLVSALRSGNVDVAIGTSDLLALTAEGIGKVIFSANGKPDSSDIFGSFVVTDSFAKRYPQTTQRVVDAFVRAAHFASQEGNRGELLRIWSLTGAPSNAVAANYQGSLLKDRLSPLPDDFYRDELARGIQFAQQQRLIRHPIDINQWIDESYIQRSIATYGYRDWTPRKQDGSPKI
jgi:sulfonate transport system substrate-binding protein